MFRLEDQRPLTPQFAVRVAVISGIALVCFGVIFFRLWYLEVLSGDEYRAQAENNRIREIRIQAPRGEILDRKGRTLVANRTALSLQVQPDRLPRNTSRRNDLLRDLAEVAEMPYPKIKKQIRRQTRELPANPVTLARDVDRELVYYLRERQDKFPGVTAEEVSVREYPKETLGAHLFGFVSEVNEEQLEQPQYADLDPGDRIGASGVEAQYDRALRGRNGAIQVPVDAFGRPRGDRLSEIQPETGNDLVLTIDAKLQAAGEEAISGFGKSASFVVMNVNDGAILAMGSYPSFDPSIYTPPVSFDEIEALQAAEGDPLFNKAIQSSYPTGSTFKAITGTASLEEGLVTPSTVESDAGVFEYGGREWINAGKASYGSVNAVSALRVSSDIYYYKQGIKAQAAYEKDGNEVFQDWAEQFGFGGMTGVDLPGEGPGFVPTPEWRNELFKQAADPDSCSGEVRDYLGCGETDRKWSVGDNMNLSVGQGDLQATPLQLAIAYAAIANGGQVLRPHVAQKVQNPLGQTEEEFTPAPRRELGAAPETLAVIRDGIHQAASAPGGTSYQIFGNYPVDVAGKTGTAETPQGDQSWYASWAPHDAPEIVVVATIEGGGFGSEAAAPAVRQIYDAYFKVKPEDVEEAEEGLDAAPAAD
jgi:penicillin-binding protein 2